jgi:hypothetical protein
MLAVAIRCRNLSHTHRHLSMQSWPRSWQEGGCGWPDGERVPYLVIASPTQAHSSICGAAARGGVSVDSVGRQHVISPSTEVSVANYPRMRSSSSSTHTHTAREGTVSLTPKWWRDWGAGREMVQGGQLWERREGDVSELSCTPCLLTFSLRLDT